MKTVIGLMSGTSVDAIDCVIMQFSGQKNLRWQLIGCLNYPWQPVVRTAILDACRPDYPVQQLTLLNFRLGQCFAQAVLELCTATGYPVDEVDAIACHGQTVWHQPTAMMCAEELARGTVQIGEPAVIASMTGRVVLSDFRAADMAVGGQGAPLVPWWDWRVMSSTRESRIVQNIGGIANATYLPQRGNVNNVIAFDTGPGNMVIDWLMASMTGGATNFDDGGTFASTGRVNNLLLSELLEHPFFSLPPPRSTGRESFGAEFARRVLHTAKLRRMCDKDIVATVTELTAVSIADAYRKWLPNSAMEGTVVLGGGGVRNAYLVDRLQLQLAGTSIKTHSHFGIPDDFREAMAFALLGYERLLHRCSNVMCATGASRPVCLGKSTLPPG